VNRELVAHINKRRERRIQLSPEEVMLLLFKGPYRIAAQLIVGIALLVVGVVAHATLAAVIGGVLILWGLYNAITRRRPGKSA
jgi:hypothetical protein